MKEKCVGFIKYEGALVKGGVMDARKQGQALLAVDHALRYFIAEQIYDHVHDGVHDNKVHDNKVHDNKVHDRFRKKIHKEVYDIGFEIPVKVKEGSWELQLLEQALNLLGSGVDIAINAYMARLGYGIAGSHLANIKNLFKKSADMIKWTAKIATHLGPDFLMPPETEEHPTNKLLVVVINNKGERLDVPKDVLDKYIRYDVSRLLKALAEIVEKDRCLRIGLEGEVDDIIIDLYNKVFLVQKLSGDMLFSELEHGESFELEGEVVSADKRFMGFVYREGPNGTLKAYPENGTIVPHRDKIFRRCNLQGTVCRKDGKGGTAALTPKLCFTAISIIR